MRQNVTRQNELVWNEAYCGINFYAIKCSSRFIRNIKYNIQRYTTERMKKYSECNEELSKNLFQSDSFIVYKSMQSSTFFFDK